MNPLRITVVTPSFNQADFLEETLRSVLDQSYPNLEYIVMDGGSTDGSVEIIKKYSDRLTYWTSESDQGQSDAINKGFARATGDVFCWINSDDLLLPGSLEKVAKYFSENPDWQLLTGGCGLIHGNSKFSRDECSIRYLSPDIQEIFTNWNKNWFAQQSTFWRSELWRTVGPLRTDLQFTMDFDLWRRFAEKFEIHSVPEVLAIYRFHEAAKCMAEHGTKSIEMFQLRSEEAPLEARSFLNSIAPLFRDLASEYDAQHLRLQKLLTENKAQAAHIAMQHSHIESYRNSRWIRVGGSITRLLNSFRPRT